MRQKNIGAYSIKNAGKKTENISIEKYVQMLVASKNQAVGKILAAAKNQVDCKILAAKKIRQIVKSLRSEKIRQIVKSLRPEKIRRRIESLRALISPRLVKNQRLQKSWRDWKSRRNWKSRRPAYCLGSAESPTSDFSLVPLMSSRSSPRKCDESRM